MRAAVSVIRVRSASGTSQAALSAAGGGEGARAIGAAGATDSNVEVATAGNARVRHPGRGAGASPVGRGHRERVRRAATSLHASATDPSACPAALTDDDTPGALADETTIVVAVDDVKVYELGKHGVPRP